MHSSAPIVVLGAGYTGRRVALSAAQRGIRVIVTTRNQPASLFPPGVEVWQMDARDPLTLRGVPKGCVVLHSIPTMPGAEGEFEDPTPKLIGALGDRPCRMVYLSTTGVYGDVVDVDENTVAAPRTRREMLRVAAEQAISAGPWSSLILRPAAIYGPGRGIHVSMSRGDFKIPGDGTNVVSRIHVDDLANHANAGLFSDLTGAWPVADDYPCTSIEIAEYCAAILGIPLPDFVSTADVQETRRANRRVDGRAIRSRLAISLQYPSYRTGIPASHSPQCGLE